MTRDERRARTERAKGKARRVLARTWFGPVSAKAVGIWSNRRTLCSCAGCGNPRRHFGGRTRQELRAVEVRP